MYVTSSWLNEQRRIGDSVGDGGDTACTCVSYWSEKRNVCSDHDHHCHLPEGTVSLMIL